MLADWSRLLRWTLLLVIGFFALARPTEVRKAWAGGGDDDDDSASPGDDSGGGGGDDDDDGGGGGDDDATQPAVTSGGLFTKATYPISELQRPLTITGGMTEIRGGLAIDVSNSNAFKQFGLAFDARRGFSDNVEGLVHINSDLNQFKAFDLSAAIEGSIVYDVVDFRIGFNLPVTRTSTMGATSTTTSTGAKFGIPFGFPFRYAPKPQIGIVALETFMTIDTDSVPDFTPAVAIVVQPIPALALKLHAAVDVANFDFSTTNLVIPVSANIQYSPNNLLDFGGEFQFPNLKPPAPAGGGDAPKFYDSRALLLYLQLRV